MADGKGIASALQRGASAVMLGTRFVATAESNAHPLYKAAIVKARATDAVSTLCFDGGWPYAAHRVLRNKTLDARDTAGCPPSGQRPGEGEAIAKKSSRELVISYDDAPPLVNMEGEVLDCALYAGLSCGKIKDVPKAADLFARLWCDCEKVMQEDGLSQPLNEIL